MLEKGVAHEEERFDAAIIAANHAAGAPPLAAPPAPVAASQALEPPRPQPEAQTRGRNTSPPPPMPIPTIPGGSIAHAILSTTSAKSPSPVRTSRSPPSGGPPFTTPAEDAQLLHATTSNNATNSNSTNGNTSTTSSPRSSGEQARGLGLRNLLHKPRPNEPAPASSAPPPVAPKPNPPAARYNAPSTPPPPMPVPHPPANPAGMAGVGTATGGTPMGGGVANPPRAVMMAHQSSLSATGNPYEMALGSGARIVGTDSGVVSTPVPAPVVPAAQPAEPVPTETSNPRRSIEGSTVQFANRINGLALNMTRLRMFQERQDMVFKILASVRD